MSRLFRNLLIVASALVIAGCSTMGGMGGSSGSQSTMAKQAKLAGNAQTVLQQQMSRPNAKRIPNQLVANARCIAVFPSVVEAGFIVGGHHGKGLVTCRQKSGGFESANPAVYSLSGGSIGLQAGAQKSSVILLFETPQSVDALLQPKIKLGSQISVTAGPSGYNHAITRASAPVVAYVMSQKGLYAGIDLSGSKMSFDQSANDSLYGASATPRGVLLGSGMQPAGAMTSFKQTLQRFAPSGHQGASGNQQQSQQSGSNQSQMNENQQQSGGSQSQTSGGQRQQSGMSESQSSSQSTQSNTSQ